MPVFGLIIGLLRQTLVPVFVFYLFTTVFGLGPVGIWRGIFGITSTVAFIAALYANRILAKLEKGQIIV